ncbi:MAG: LytR family transcriptional regulator [Thermoleophilia bacterium]|nr:LytR family transcriptional regulator [Thermoleophilia bacterium]
MSGDGNDRDGAREVPIDEGERPTRWYRVPRRRRRWPWAILWVGVLVLGVGGGLAVASISLFGTVLDKASPDTPDVQAAQQTVDPDVPGEPINILLIGSDGRSGTGDRGRSDSLILIRMDGDQGFISMLSFPRDLYVDIPGHGMNKINAAFPIGGPAMTIATIKKLTGQPINYFVNIDFEGFVKLVDQVGGVYMDVDRTYFNENVTGDGVSDYEEIDLKPGYQRMSGIDALDYVRYRHTDSDFARIARQQAFLSELKRQTNRFGNLPEIPSYARIFSESVITNVRSVPRLLGILEQAITTDKDRIARASISGTGAMRNGASIVGASQSEVDATVDAWLHPEFTQGAVTAVVDPNSVTVSVRNGSGRLLAAETATKQLRAKGFAATSGGNAETFGVPRTVVQYAEDSREEAKNIARLFGADTVLSALPKTRKDDDVDVRVRVGESYDGELVVPKKRTAAPKATAHVVDTTSLVALLRRVEKGTGLAVMVPTRVPVGSALKVLRAYRVNTGGDGPQAVKMVFRVPTGTYWGYQMLAWPDPPLLEGRTGVVTSGGREYSTFYDGKNLMRLAWQKGGVTYWISNTLDYALSPETMYAVAKSARPLARVVLRPGATPVEIPLEQDAYTP